MISPVVTFTAGSFSLLANASTMADAVRSPIPGTWAKSSTLAARSFFSDPKYFSSALRRTSPSPGTSSSRTRPWPRCVGRDGE